MTFGFESTTTDVLAGIDLTGTTAVVTGGSSGLGRETVRALATAGARVVVPARNPEAARDALRDDSDVAEVQVVPMDLTDLGSVRAAASAMRERLDRVDLLLGVAGVMATPQRLVGPGWDYQFASNHLGHFTLVNELYSLLVAGGARVVLTSSAGHMLSDIRWDDPHFRTGYDKWLAYGQSKTANVLHAVHLDERGRADGVRAFALHPGKILTNLTRDMDPAELIAAGWIDEHGTVVDPTFKTVEQGAATGVWAATSPLLDGRGGLYLEDCDIAEVAPDGSMDDGGVRPYAVDPESAARLWQLSARECSGVL